MDLIKILLGNVNIMYTIKIHYRTGSSFGSHEEVDFINFAWNNINYCSEALSFIEKHNEYFDKKNYFKYGRVGSYKIKNNNIFEKYGEEYVPAKDDNGNDIKIPVFWRGYFETLIEASIVTSKNK